MAKKNYNGAPTKIVQTVLHTIPRTEYERFVFEFIEELDTVNKTLAKKIMSTYNDQLESEYRTHASKKFKNRAGRGEIRIKQNAARRTIRRGLYTMSHLEFAQSEELIRTLCTKISAVIKMGG